MHQHDIACLKAFVGEVLDHNKLLRYKLYNECHSHPVPDVVVAGSIYSGTQTLYQNLLQHPNCSMNVLCHFDYNRAKKQRLVINHEGKKVALEDSVVYFAPYFAKLQALGSMTFNDEQVTDFLHQTDQLVKTMRLAFNPEFLDPIGSKIVSIIDDPNLLHTDPTEAIYKNPGKKLIFVLRDPIERAYSNYKGFFNANPGFDKSFEECIQLDTLKDAVENNKPVEFSSDLDHHQYLLIARSLYSQWFKAYLNVIPKNQFFIISNHTLKMNPHHVMKKLFQFLDLPEIRYNPIGNVNPNPKTFPPIKDETREFLNGLFRPYNMELQRQLKDVPGVFNREGDIWL